MIGRIPEGAHPSGKSGQETRKLIGVDHRLVVLVFGVSLGVNQVIFYGIIWGTRTAFYAGLIVTISTLLIGVVYGSIAAFYGGWVDMVMMRIVDVLSILPGVLAALILAAILIPTIGKSTIPVMIALIAFGWMGYSRFIRADILSVRERDYILAARVVGVPDGRILFQHILPNAIFPTLILASKAIGDVVLSFAALSFLGVGVEVGYADWGQLLSFARNWITSLKDAFRSTPQFRAWADRVSRQTAARTRLSISIRSVPTTNVLGTTARFAGLPDYSISRISCIKRRGRHIGRATLSAACRPERQRQLDQLLSLRGAQLDFG